MRWRCRILLSLALFLAAGHLAVSRAQNRVGGTTSEDVAVSAQTIAEEMPESGGPDPRAAEFRRRISGMRPLGGAATPAGAPAKRSARRMATRGDSPSPSAFVRSRARLHPDDAPPAKGSAVAADTDAIAGADADVPPPKLMPHEIGSDPAELQLVGFAPASKEEPSDDDLRKQLELQRQQIDVLEKMVKLTAEELHKQGGPSTGDLEERIATLESRSRQAADRDQQLAGAVDNLNDHLDAQWRYGPQLPSQLKEWFLPGGTNESPLAIYGQLLMGYHQFNGQAAQFESPVFSPYFLLTLNNRFLVESSVDFGSDGTIDVSQAQMDWIISDSVTGVVGRYLTPIGFFNERLNHEWINKLPDTPLMFNQVSPLLSTNGLQVRGSRYIFGSPVKVEYSLYGGNAASLGTAPSVPANQQVADLAALTASPGNFNALGGRLGAWIPAIGLNFGMSGYSQGGYTPAAGDRFQLFGFDASYHYGNWDARFEFAQSFQQAGSYIGNDIRRTGLYAQLAYRDYQNSNPILSSLEVVGRFSMARFSGIDPTLLDLTAFDPINEPVDRNQYTLGINYYLYPSMIAKFAYEWNPALGGIALNENVFMSQFIWAF